MEKIRSLSEFEYGALKEIGNIGIGNSAVSLSRLVNSLVCTRVLDTKFELIEDIPKIVGFSESPVIGTLMSIKENLNGYILVFFPESSARSLCLNLSSEEGKSDLIDTINLSLIEEVSHILAGTYITSLAKFLKLDLSISTPYTAYDMSDSIFNSAVAEMGYIADFALVLDAEFLIKEKKIDGNVLILLDPESLNNLLKKINTIIDQMSLFQN
ncbi:MULTISPECIES: chemotaxis protein CheC [unclassified Methanosarcina]|uniref:chemotaxis protein CheC n=1 Tax=unclassified Methanosarcina TaxID=2644672 RepID=UPI000615930B|nr:MULTISPECIES: chemotaxis protein CheC [unclassified Methanosarcina]AKB20262.1 Chemotaxis protein CheC -- inhibitor of MCP methylation [Methanosarcina sp. WWM596]AKB23461.1 Chemotaxis protein CheC -- inhibitor of MCP methylation [Methanosarcina sp. WH1]